MTVKGIQVGNAYIKITPDMDQAALSREIALAEEKWKGYYTTAKGLANAYTQLQVKLEKWITDQYGQQLAGRLKLTEDAIKARKKFADTEAATLIEALSLVNKAALKAETAKTAAKTAAERRNARIALNARDLEVKYGQQVADAYLQKIQQMQAGKKKLTLVQINETKRWAELEISEIRRVEVESRRLQQEVIRGAQAEAIARTESAKKSQAAYTTLFAQVKRDKLEQMTLDRDARLAFLQGEVQKQTAIQATAAAQLASTRTNLAQITAATGFASTTMVKKWKGVAGGIEKAGTTAGELGRTLMTSVVAPLATAGAALTAWGLKAADNFQNTQTSLENMGMALKDANALMNNLTTYGLQTPYAVGDMLTYGTRIARAAGAHNKNFTSADPKKHATGSAQVSQEAQNIVQMIGDLAARGGITDSAMVQRGYYAMEKLMDANRVSLRDTKQLEYATNTPVQELSQLLGFKDTKYTKAQVTNFKKVNPGFHAKVGDIYPASAMMMEVMANSKTTGGVRGQDMVEALLSYWNGKTAVPGGKPDKNLKGAAELLGTATFSSRLSNMKETAQQNLRGMVQQFNPKTKQLEYTGLGETIMGKRVQVKGKDGKLHNQWQGGLLNSFSGIGSSLMGPKDKNGQYTGQGAVPQLMTGFVEGLTTLIGWIKKTAGFLDSHPGLVNMMKEGAKLAAVIAPLAIGLGIFAKLIGKTMKLFSPVVKGVVGAGKLASQMTGLGSKTEGDKAAKAIRAQAKRDATQLRRDAKKETDSRNRAAKELNAKWIESDAKQRAKAAQDQARADTSWRQRYQQRRTNLNGDPRSLGQRGRDSVLGRDTTQQDVLKLDASQFEAAMKKAGDEIKKLKQAIQNLNRQNLNQLASEEAGNDTSVEGAAKKAAKAAGKAQDAIKNLNKEKLKALRGQVTTNITAVNQLGTGAQGAAGHVTTLNAKDLKKLKKWFNNVRDAADEAIHKVSELTSKIQSLNGHKLDTVTKHVKDLSHELDQAGIHAHALNLTLDDIGKKGPGNGGKGGGNGPKPKKGPKPKAAKGAIMPGYAPGVDSIEAILSPGEAVLRPEVTRAIGHDKINLWNSMAVRGKIPRRFAGGGVVNKLGLNKLIDVSKSFNIAPDALSAFATMTMDSSSRALGGSTQDGVVGTGSIASKFMGSDLATKFKGIFDFMSTDSWKFLKRLPTAVGQGIGIVGGALAPVAQGYLWDDVWKGNGNVLQRGNTYMNDLMSVNTVKSVVGNLFGGLWDSVTSIVGTAKDLVTDPVGTAQGAVNGVWDLVRSEYDGVIGMVDSLGSIWTSPMDYAGQVIGDAYSTAKDSLPNTKGLFDFSGKGLTAKAPDVTALANAQLSKPGSGSAVSRWTPQVKMALGQLGLSPSNLALVLHRIGVESGGNPKAVNKWDSNAKAGHPSQGLMQTIPGTFAAYAGPYKGRGITDPMASIYAGLNYAIHRYPKSWQKALSGTKGYAAGTPGASRGWAWVGERGPELVKFGGGETVLNHQDSILSAVKALRGYASGTGDKPRSGVAVDAEKGVSSLNNAVKKLYSIITKAFTSGRIGSGTENALNKWLDKENRKLTSLVSQRATIATKLKAANTALAKVKADESNMATSISDTAKGQRSLTTIFNTDGVSVSTAISGLKSRLANIKKFQANISTLVKRGFSKDIISEIAQAGPEQGAAMATELLNAKSGQIVDMNNTYSAIGNASDALGKSVAGQYYASGKKAAQSLVNGLTSKDKKLTKQIEAMADDIVKTLKKKLHFNSKTPVNSGLATLLTWLTGESQSVSYTKKQKKGKTTTVSTSYSTNSKGQNVTTVTTTTRDPAKGTTTTVTERTVNGKTTTTKRTSRTKGYATGTLSASPGLAMVGEMGPELVNFGGGERVYNARKTAAMAGPKYEIHIHEAKSENTTQAVLRAMKYAEVMAGL